MALTLNTNFAINGTSKTSSTTISLTSGAFGGAPTTGAWMFGVVVCDNIGTSLPTVTGVTDSSTGAIGTIQQWAVPGLSSNGTSVRVIIFAAPVTSSFITSSPYTLTLSDAVTAKVAGLGSFTKGGGNLTFTQLVNQQIANGSGGNYLNWSGMTGKIGIVALGNEDDTLCPTFSGTSYTAYTGFLYNYTTGSGAASNASGRGNAYYEPTGNLTVGSSPLTTDGGILIIGVEESGAATFSATTVGNATAAGNTGSMYTPNATFSATTASSATASGGSGALRADKTLTTTVGNANAAGNSGSFTGTGATRTWRNYATNVDGSGSDSTPTFSVDIGSASSDRWVVVAIVGREPSWTDITVNGTSLPNRVNYGGGQHPVIIAWGLVTTGSGTVTVAVNTGGTPSASWAMSGCWTITGAGTDLLLLRDADGASTNGTLTTAGSYTLTTVAGDFIFGGTNCLGAGANGTVTWSQGTKRADFTFGTQIYSVMDLTADGSTEVIQATHAEGVTNPAVTDAALYFAPQANATLTTSTGNANAAGNQGSMGVISFLTTTVGNANAAGNQGSMYGVTSATLTTTTGNASAAGGVGFMAASDPPLAGTGQGAYTLRVIDGSTEYELPDYQTVAMGYEFSDTGSVKIAYRKGGINADRLTDNAIVVARWNGVEKPNSRWRILAGETDDVAENAFVTHTGLSLFDIFRRVVVIPAGGAASITFSAASPGAILDNLFDAAQARGAMTGITWDFTGSVDSSATAWAKVVSIEYKAGVKYIDIIRDMITKGMLEARFTGYEFEAFNADGLGTTTTVELIAGKDYRELPRKWSSENRIKFSLALGDENTIVTTTDNTITDGPFGREEGAVSQGGTADTGTLTLVNNAAIAKYKEIREQLTRKVVIRPGGYVPVIDYQVADYIRERVTSYVGGSIRTASQQYRLRSIVVELGADGQIGEASITLNDQFLEDQIRLARRVDGIIGGPTGDGGGNGVPTDPVDVTPDETVPNPPTGVVIDSAAYNDGQGKPRSLMTIGWNAPTQNTNATQLTDLMDYEVQVHKSTDTDWTTFTTTLTNYALSNLDPGTQYYVRVRARDTAETMHVSTWAPSDTGQLSGALEGDTTPPAVPSQLSGSIKLTVPTLIWNGLNSTGGGMDADFDYCWLHRSTTSGFTPSTGTRIGKMWPGAYTAAEQGYGTPYYYKLTAVDTSGNESAGNTQFSLTATKLVDTDLAQAIIDDIQQGINDAAAAQADADAALTAANGKNKVTYSANGPGSTANTAGDIWFQQTGNVITGQWIGLGGTSWQSVTLRDEVIATLSAGKITSGTLDANRIAANSLSIGQVNNLQTSLDSKVRTWVQAGIPTSTAIGELWVDTDDSNKTYIARMVGADQITAGEWELVSSSSTDLTKTWVQASIPTATAIGDLWADTDDGNRMYISRAVGADQIVTGEWEPFYTATTMNYTRDPNGVNKWLRTRYNISTSGVPYITLIEGQVYAERVLVADGTSLANGLGDNYIGHLRTLVRKDTAGTVSWTMLHDDGCTVYLDGSLKYSASTYNASASIALGTVPVGLHVLDILWAEQGGGDGIYNLSAAIGTLFNELNAPLSVEARTFVQASIPVSTSVGDMWVDTDDGNKTYVAKSAGADAITTGEWELFKSDAVVVTFTQAAIPVSQHVGDMWVDTDDQNKTYIARIVGADQITAGEWELLQSETVGLVAGWKMTGQTTINGGQIATDTITAAAILAGSIGVTKLAVGDTSNLVDINESYAPSVSDTTGNGNPHEITTVSGVRWSRRSATNDADFYFSNIKWPVPFKEGDRIKVRLNAYSDVATNADVVVHIFDATPTYLRSQTIGSISITTGDTLFTVEADISAATMQNAARFQFALANLTTGREVRVRSVRAYVMNAGLLVVDGSILTDKLAANAVTADKIQAGAIIAEKLGLGVLRSNMVGDPSFEEDYTLSTWAIDNPGNTAQWRKFGGGGGSAVRYIGDGRSGATSMHIYTPGQTADPDEDYCVLSPVYWIETGKTYRVIVNATALTANAQLYVEAWTGTTPGNVYSTGSTTTLTGIGSGFGVSVPYVSVVTPSSYGSYSANMTTSANRYCALRVMNWNPAAASTLVVDDISIVEVGQGGASELTAAGLRLFDNLGNEVGAFVTGRPNFFSIAKMVGDQVETIASISAAGTADFTDLAVDADPRVAGFPLLGTTKDWQSPHTDGGLVTGYFDKVSRGLIAYGRGSDASYSSGSIAELSFIAEPGRSYRLSFSGAYGSHSGSGSHGFWIGFATPTSPGGDATGVTAPAGQYSYKYQSAGGVAGTYPAVSMTVRCNKDGTGYGGELNAGRNRFFIGVDTSVSTSYGWDFTVEDLGPDMPDTYNANTSSSGSSSAPQTYTSVWECNSSDAYTGSANADTSTTDLVQGYYTADKGNQYSVLLFTNNATSGQAVTVATAMSSATVVKAEVYLYFKHWNEPLGGTAIIRANTLTSLASTAPSGGSVSSANWPKPGGRWVDITSIWNTSQRGIWLGPGTSTSLLYYGRAASHADSTNKPQLRLTYRK